MKEPKPTFDRRPPRTWAEAHLRSKPTPCTLVEAHPCKAGIEVPSFRPKPLNPLAAHPEAVADVPRLHKLRRIASAPLLRSSYLPLQCHPLQSSLTPSPPPHLVSPRSGAASSVVAPPRSYLENEPPSERGHRPPPPRPPSVAPAVPPPPRSNLGSEPSSEQGHHRPPTRAPLPPFDSTHGDPSASPPSAPFGALSASHSTSEPPSDVTHLRWPPPSPAAPPSGPFRAPLGATSPAPPHHLRPPSEPRGLPLEPLAMPGAPRDPLLWRPTDTGL